MAQPLLIAKNAQTECVLLPGMANRHGLVTGATGAGKTVTLQAMAENFSKAGVPVFMADVKGDLTGISQAGNNAEKLAAVLKDRGLPPPQPLACPTTLWDACSASKAIRCAPPSRTWARCCWAACWA